MICHLTKDYFPEVGDSSPTLQFMAAMQEAKGMPDLSLLALAIAQTEPSLPAISRITISIDTENAVGLDSSWDRRQAACLVAEAGCEPRWITSEFDWPGLMEAANDSAQACCVLPIKAAEAVIAAVVWEGALEAEETAAEVMLMAQAISLVTAGWSRWSTLTLDLATVRRENQSLQRLNLLQGRFVAMASHEFKTPLTSITAYVDVLSEQLTDNDFPHATEFLGVIKSESDRLLRMVHRILDFTRMEYGSDVLARKATELGPLVAETVRSMRPAIDDMDLKVSVSSDSYLPRAEVDADLIRQVLVNLIGNAVKYSPRGGGIVIKLRELESAISVSVADNGPGIATDDIRRVFREFYRGQDVAGREPGSGLGLTIARHIVNLHGGHIEVRQRESGGSDFRFSVPKEIGGANSQPNEVVAGTEPTEMTLLIAELLRLFAELTGSRAVSLLLRDEHGVMAHVGSMGWQTQPGASRPVLANEGWTRFMHSGSATTELGAMLKDLSWCPVSRRRDENMFAPIGSGQESLGVVITGRRRDNAAYNAADLVQLNILSDVAFMALNSSKSGLGHTIEAVRLLLKIRRSGVPTSTPEALDLLARLAHRFDLGEMAIRRIQYAAALHDAGMGRVEEEIVLGGNALAHDERDEVDRHVEQGVDLMAPLLPDAATTDVMRHHHEMYDGTGYPAGLSGTNIPMGSRLLAVIDAWFALTRDRTYRKGLAPIAAFQEIVSHAGTQFDPKIVNEFEVILQQSGQLPAPSLDHKP